MPAHRRLARTLGPLLLLLVLLVGAVPARAVDYKIDEVRSTLLLRIWKEGQMSALAHDHVIRATRCHGVVRYDASRPEAASVQVEAMTAALMADEPTYRRRFGLGPLNEQSRREVQKTMLSDKQMDAARYPTIAFRSTRVVADAAGTLRITGTLSLHGQSRELTFPANVDIVQGLVRARATLRFRQSDFGITPYSFKNTVRNQDEVEMRIELIGAPPG